MQNFTAIPLEKLANKLLEIGFSERAIRSLLKDDEFRAIQRKTDQMVFLKNYAREVLNVELEKSALAKIFDIHISTVSRSIERGLNAIKMPGKKVQLETSIENEIVEEILQRHNQGNPFSKVELLRFVNEKYNVSLTNGWVGTFLKRNEEKIKKVKSIPQEDTRLSVPRDFLIQHIINLKNVIEGRMTELIFNLDEVGSSDWEDRKVKTVLVSSEVESRTVFHSVKRCGKHLSLLACISMAGDCLTPMLITNYKISDEIYEDGLREGEDVLIRHRDSPYMDKNYFLEYIKEVLIPYIVLVREKLNCPNEEAILLMDSCSPHVFIDVLKLLGENNIIAFTFPPHTTNLFQPLDLSLFGALKSFKSHVSSEEDGKYIKSCISKLLKSFEQVSTSFTIRGSFKRAGLIPIMNVVPHLAQCNVSLLIDKYDFKNIWDRNTKITDISTRRRNQRFGVINEEYLPPGARVKLGFFDKIQELEEIS